jgi:flagellin
MSLRINHNIQSLNGHRAMIKNDMAISKSLEKLSSGLRINKAADDASGLVISEQMRAQITGLNAAIKNSENAVSMVQTAEGAFDEVSALLNKARQLVIHAANTGVNDTNAVTADQQELDNILTSITRIADTTQFATKKLLDGSLANITVNATGTIAGITSATLDDTANITLGAADLTVTAPGTAATQSTVVTEGSASAYTDMLVGAASAVNVTVTTLFALGGTLSIAGTSTSIAYAAGESVGTALTRLNAAAASDNVGVSYSLAGAGVITSTASEVGTYANSYSLVFSSGGSLTLTQAAPATGVNADISLTDAGAGPIVMALTVPNRGLSFASTLPSGLNLNLTFDDSVVITSQVGALTFSEGAVFQIGGNRDQTVAIGIPSAKAIDLGKGAVDDVGAAIVNYSSLDDLRTSSFLTGGRAQDALSILDQAIDEVTVLRGRLGAFQGNTLESALSSLRVSTENLTAAESTIRDVDFAAESATFTRNSILIQSATAMLAQSNQLPQNVLKLLQ